MQHSFDIAVAKEYGIQPAILLNNLYWWIEKNRANEQNFYDGHYWTYNSKKAFAELFPYMNARQIDYALKKLIDAGLVITGNYNKIAYDRTLWYAITKKGYCILQNCKMEDTKLIKATNEIVDPIPNINSNINSNIITVKESKKEEEQAHKKQGVENTPLESKKTQKGSFDRILESYTKDETTLDLLQEWLKVRKAKRAAMTDRAIQMNINKLDSLAKASNMSINEYLSEVICKGWAAFYEIKTYGNNNQRNNTTGNVFLDIAKDEGMLRHEYTKAELEDVLYTFEDNEKDGRR